MLVELPLAEVIDKITILEIKQARIKDPARLTNVHAELAALRGAWAQAGHPYLHELHEAGELAEVNGQLWDVEDALRELEAAADFGPGFVQLARSVYHLNDRRAALKKALNLRLGSRLVEEKSYADYGGHGGGARGG